MRRERQRSRLRVRHRVLAVLLVASVRLSGWAAETNLPPLPPVPPQPPPRPATPPLQAVPAMARTSSVPAVSRSTTPRPSLPPAAPTAPAVRLSAPGAASTNAVRRLLEPFPLVFAEDAPEVTVEAGATNARLQFAFTNASGKEVTLQRLHTSCGCTTAKMPPLPWVLPAGTNGEFEISMDLRGKRGRVTKMLYVYTDRSFKALSMRVIIPSPEATLAGERLRNLQASAADRQAVFRGNCSVCHSDPGRGKQGRELFQAVCAVCHEAQQRAAMVPDLRTLQHPTDADHWRHWIQYGKAYTLMPAFAENQGGPLGPEQVESLVEHLLERIPSGTTTPFPAAAPAARTNAGPTRATATE